MVIPPHKAKLVYLRQNLLVFISAFLCAISCSESDNSARIDSGFKDKSFEYLIGEADSQTVLDALADKKGKVVLLNMWATWCQPCVEEFPDIVSLYNKYKDRGLDVITVSHDFVPSLADSFLIAQKADFTNYLIDFNQDGHYFIVGIDENWYGALPATWLFDRNGQRQFFVEERFNSEELEQKIVEMLAK